MKNTADLFPAAEFTGVTVDEREKWLALRRTMLTASKTAALFGESPFMSAFELYVDFITERKGFVPVSFDSPMFWGTALEVAIFQAAASYYKWETAPGGQLIRSRAHPELGATLDGAIRLGGRWIPYEGKTTSAWRARDWDEEEGRAPTHVIIQVQHQLMVTQADVAVVFCLIGGQRPVRIEIEASADFHIALVEEAQAFLERVRNLDPPPVMATEQCRNAIHRLHPEGNGAAVMLPPEAVEWTRQYREITAEIKRLEKRKLGLQNALKESIGDVTFGILPEPVDGKSCWRWELEQNAGYTVEPYETRKLIALKDAPPGMRLGGPLPPLQLAERTVLEAQLEESLAQPAEKIRFTTKRKRARR